MESQLASIRLELAERVRQKQANRTERVHELHRELAELEAQELPLQQAAIRANGVDHPTSCPTCWVWDGKVVELTAQPSPDDQDLFRCRVCGEAYSFMA